MALTMLFRAGLEPPSPAISFHIASSDTPWISGRRSTRLLAGRSFPAGLSRRSIASPWPRAVRRSGQPNDGGDATGAWSHRPPPAARLGEQLPSDRRTDPLADHSTGLLRAAVPEVPTLE